MRKIYINRVHCSFITVLKGRVTFPHIGAKWQKEFIWFAWEEGMQGIMERTMGLELEDLNLNLPLQFESIIYKF